MTTGNSLLFEISDKLATITFNRADAMNAFSRQMSQEFSEAILEVKANPKTIRGLIITAAGERAFCAGADLKERKTMSPADVNKFLTVMNSQFVLLENLDQITISCINGFALGGGLELALCTDFRIASENAQVGLTETKLGIIPGGGGTQRLPRLIGTSKAKRLIYSGRRLTASEAKEWGVVDETVATPADLVSKAKDLLAEFADSAPVGLAQAKFAIQRGMEVDLGTGLAIERSAYQVTIPTKDRLEALDAFANKRKPEFTGE